MVAREAKAAAANLEANSEEAEDSWEEVPLAVLEAEHWAAAFRAEGMAAAEASPVEVDCSEDLAVDTAGLAAVRKEVAAAEVFAPGRAAPREAQARPAGGRLRASP